MATYRILFWQKIPAQIVADDDGEDVSLLLPDRFQERIDCDASLSGLHGTDDYLAQWNWSEPQERAGSAREVAEAVKAELEANTDW